MDMTPNTIQTLEELAETYAKAATDEKRGTESRAKCLRYLDALRLGIRCLKCRQSRKAFIPPTWDQVATYAHEKLASWPIKDVEAWFDHFNSNGWKVSGKAAMSDWQAAARNGFRRWKTTHKGDSVPAKGDPEGWAAWLKLKGRDWIAYQYAPTFMKDEFKAR